jgi:hypothetical protein
MCGSGPPTGAGEGDTLKARLFILAALIVVAANSAQACNENCRAIFTDPLSRKTTEGIDEACELRREACHLCARDKAESAGVTLECANCVIDARTDITRCTAICGGADKATAVFFAAGCM